MRTNLDYNSMLAQLMQGGEGCTARIEDWTEGAYLKYDSNKQRIVRCDGDSESNYVLSLPDMNSVKWEVSPPHSI